MKANRVRRATVLAFAIALITPTTAFAGGGGDPNVGDDALGTSGGVRYRSDSALFDLGESVEVEVGCGGTGWHLIGGGSRAGGPADQAWTTHGRPLDFTDPDPQGDDGWLAGGHGAAGAGFTGYSICVRGQGLRYQRKVVEDSPNGQRIGDVGCGGAAWHVTSGSAFIATTGSWINSSYPMDGPDPDIVPDDGWHGRAFDMLGGTGAFEVHAVCVRGPNLRYASSREIAVPEGQTLTRRVGCTKREHVVGGGASVSGSPANARLVESVPFDDADAKAVPDDGWEIRVHAVSGLVDRRVTTYAICLG